MAHRKLLKGKMLRRYKHCICLAIVLAIFMPIINGCASKGPHICYLGKFHGRIYDVDTGEPIEGAVVHVTYYKHGSSVAGTIGKQVAVRETLTDADGEYLIPEDRVTHECFSGQLQGDMQIFKPGYGVIGNRRLKLTCPENEREKVFKHDEPSCLTIAGKYLIWGLPRLKTKEERDNNLNYIRPAFDISFSEQAKLRKAISEERVSLGYPPLSNVEPGGNHEK